MRVALVEPPATDPRSPHLAMASLHAALALDGATVEVIDAGAEGLHWLLRPERVEAALTAARLHREDDPATHYLHRFGDLLVTGAAEALDALRDPQRFYDAAACDEAREMIGKALLAHSLASRGHQYGIAPIGYQVDGVDAGKLADLAAITTHTGPFGPFFAEVADRIAAFAPEVVALSILNHQQIIPGLTLARMLRDQGHLVVLGGTVYAKFADALRARPHFFELFCDAVCVYEGETALRALAAEATAAQAEGRPPHLAKIPNLLWLDHATGTVAAGPVHSEDVASLPTPDFRGFDLGLYLTPEPVLPILTGKGCYFNRCKFCDIPYINRVAPRPYRRRSPQQVADDMAQLWERHGARHFVVTDEALAPRFLLQIADALGDTSGFEPRLVGYARFEPGFTAEVCQALHRAGVRRLFFGLEAGSQRMLDHMDKGVRVDVARRVVRDCAAAGIGVHLFSMLGLPSETPANARETLQFFLDNAALLDHPRHSLDLHRFNLDLRTDYFDNAANYGIVVDTGALAERDFPLDAPAWQLTDGLSHDEVDRLLDEFSAELRTAFVRSRAFPSHIYPSFEEYSVLYADHFDPGGDWSLRFALPPEDDATPCTLSWCRHLAVTAVPGGVVVSGATGERALSRQAFELLHPTLDRALPMSSVLDELLGSLRPAPAVAVADQLRTELRAIIDDLLGAGLLRLRTASLAGATP